MHTHTHTHTHKHTHTHTCTHTHRFTGRLETVGSVRSKRQRQDECWAVTWKKTKSEHVTQRKGDCSRERDQYTVQANSPSALHKTLSQTKTKGIRLPEESASPRMMGGCLDAFIMEVKVTTSDLVRQPPPLHSPRIRIIRYFCSKASHQTLTWPLNQHTSYFCSRASQQNINNGPWISISATSTADHNYHTEHYCGPWINTISYYCQQNMPGFTALSETRSLTTNTLTGSLSP